MEATLLRRLVAAPAPGGDIEATRDARAPPDGDTTGGCGVPRVTRVRPPVAMTIGAGERWVREWDGEGEGVKE